MGKSKRNTKRRNAVRKASATAATGRTEELIGIDLVRKMRGEVEKLAKELGVDVA